MYIVKYMERVHMARMHELASASPPYEQVPNTLRYTFNNHTEESSYRELYLYLSIFCIQLIGNKIYLSISFFILNIFLHPQRYKKVKFFIFNVV